MTIQASPGTSLATALRVAPYATTALGAWVGYRNWRALGLITGAVFGSTVGFAILTYGALEGASLLGKGPR